MFSCDDHLLHLKNIAASLGAKETNKKIKQELLKDHKAGSKSFVIARKTRHSLIELKKKHSRFLQ